MTRSYFISAGEMSGDLLGADLVNALSRKFVDHHSFGNVGAAMRRAGVLPIYDIAELSTMGISEVLARIAEFRMMVARMLEEIDRRKPDFAVLVDFPGMHFQLAEQLRLRRIPVIQYIAPKLWAWGQKRVKRLARDFDLVLGVFPFEKEFFESRGVEFKYVGSPHADRVSRIMINREQLGLGDNKVVALLPGSRMAEIHLLLPDMLRAFCDFHKAHPETTAVLPVASSLDEAEFLSYFEPIVKKLGFSVKNVGTSLICEAGPFKVLRGMSLEVLSVADVALITSGTASLEAALLNVPHVVMYRMKASTYAMAKDLVKLPYIALPNIIKGDFVVPEYVQNIDIKKVATDLGELIQTSLVRNDQLEFFGDLRIHLQGGAAAQAADEIHHLYTNSYSNR
jgi:lipid-A-disaccharide synthase